MQNPFCTSEVVERINSCIPVTDLNRITQVVLAEKGTAITTTSVAAFTTSAKAAELACSALVFRNVNGSYGEPSYTEEPGGGTQVTRVTGAAHELSFIDFDAVNNTPGMNAARRAATNYNLYFTTATRVFIVEGVQLTIKPFLPITDDHTTTIKGRWVINWSSVDLPLNITGSTEALAELPDLGTVTITEFGAANASIAGLEVTIGSGVALEIDVNFATAASTYGVDDNTPLPTGLALNATNGQITGSVASDGEYTFNILGRTACGVTGVAEITLIVT